MRPSRRNVYHCTLREVSEERTFRTLLLRKGYENILKRMNVISAPIIAPVMTSHRL